jgi:carboxylesterase
MASSERVSPRHAPFPSRRLLFDPRTWRNRGGLVGIGSPEQREYPGHSPALLAFHGFGATPQEVDMLVEVARKRGLAACAPVLPGHATHARDLATKTFDDWLAAAQAELNRWRVQGKVILAGMSLGGLIAARLAADAPADVCGLALFGNALRLAAPYPSHWLAVAMRLRLPQAWWIPKLCADIEDPEQRMRHLGYDVEPIRAGIEVYRGGLQTVPRLKNITCPTLIVHGALDKVCPVGNVEWQKQALGTADVSTVILPRSGHVIVEDVERDQAAAALDSFIGRLLHGLPEAPG